MKLSDVVARHGFQPCGLAQIENARLYARLNADGVTELLCVQKHGELMQIDRLPLLIAAGMTLPVGDQLKKMLPKDELEGYLNTTLVANY